MHPTKLRHVLLGASNLAIALPRLYESLCSGPEASEICAAVGHGRSYGLESRFLGRRLPGIRSCGLWRHLAKQPAVTTHSLVADIGNDLLYGPPVETIAGWVEACIEELVQGGGNVAILGLPLSAIDTLGRTRFLAARSILFPACSKSRERIRDEAHLLDGKLRHLAAASGARYIEPAGAWYGLDPVHFRFRSQREVWAEVLRRWLGISRQPILSWSRRMSIWRLPPESRFLWGRRRHCPQPVLKGETSLSLF